MIAEKLEALQKAGIVTYDRYDARDRLKSFYNHQEMFDCDEKEAAKRMGKTEAILEFTVKKGILGEEVSKKGISKSKIEPPKEEITAYVPLKQ